MLRNIKVLLALLFLISPANAQYLDLSGSGGGGGSGTVTDFIFTNKNGISGVVTNATTTPTLELSLGAITPTSVVTGAISGTSLTLNGVTAKTTINSTACNLGGSCTVTSAPSGAAGGSLAGTYPNPTLTSVISAAGPIGSATVAPIITFTAEGRLTTVTSATITPAIGNVTGLGTGVATALGNTAGGAGGFALVGTTPPTGTAGGSLKGTYPNPGLADVNTVATSLAVGGGSIGTDAFEVNGSSTYNGATVHNGNATVVSASFGLNGAISSAAWTTNGIRYKNVATTLTDTSSSGTVATAYTDVWGGNTIAASSATTFTDYYNSYFTAPVAGSNVTFTRKWALGADSLNVAGAGLASNSAVLLSGAIFAAGTGTTNFPQFFIQPAGTTASTSWATTGTVIGANVSGTPNLMDLQLAGASKFSITSAGLVSAGGSILATGNIQVGAAQQYIFAGRAISTSPAAGSWQLGAADVDTNASIVAQTLRSQGTLAGGTADQSGKNWTFIASPSKGSGTPGDIILQTSVVGASGTSVNPPATVVTLKGGTSTISSGSMVLGSVAIPTNATDGFLYITTTAGQPTGVPTTFTGRVPLVYDTTNHQFWIYDGGWKQPKTPAAAAIVTWQ